MMRYQIERIQHPNGSMEIIEFDDSIDALVRTVGGAEIVEPLAPNDVVGHRAVVKERNQEQRLQANFQTLRNTPPAASLTNAQLRDEVDLLRAMLLDLTRVVRGIAAE